MAGVKGRSGRRTTTDESKRRRVIEKGWDILEEALQSSEVSLNEKIKISLELCKKSIPVEVEPLDITSRSFIHNIINKAGVVNDSRQEACSGDRESRTKFD